MIKKAIGSEELVVFHLNLGKYKKLTIMVFIINLILTFPLNSLLGVPNHDLNNLNEMNIEINDGNYLVYDVIVREYVTNNLSLVTVGADDLYEESDFISTKLRVEFHKEGQDKGIRITLSFSMHGDGFLYYNEDANGKINFNYDSIITLKGDESSNKYFYENDTEWGYLPFIIPKPSDKDNLFIAGSTYYENEVVIGEKSGNTICESPKGMQDCYILENTNNVTAFGFEDNLRLIPTYYFDSSTHILLKSLINDPFWTIFNREFVLFEGYMLLSDTNMHLGSSSLMAYIVLFLNIAGVLFIPLIFIISTLTIYSIHKYRRKQKRKKRQIVKRKRFKFKNK